MKIIGVFSNSIKSVKKRVAELEENFKEINTDECDDKQTETHEAKIIKHE